MPVRFEENMHKVFPGSYQPGYVGPSLSEMNGEQFRWTLALINPRNTTMERVLAEVGV